MSLRHDWVLIQQISLHLSILFLTTLSSCCSAQEPELLDPDAFDPEKAIEDNFFSYSQFALYYFPEVHYFDKYFTIVLFIIGFPGNFISLLVWSSKRMYQGNSAAVYLAALSLNDTVVLAIALFRDLTRAWDVPFHPTPGSCEVLETVTLTVQYASPMFVLAFTLERWLAICQPFVVSRICSVKRAVRICVGIILLTLVICSPMAYLMSTDPQGCQPRSGAVFYFTTTLEIFFSLVAPLLVLTFNCLVISEMSKIQRLRKTKMQRLVPRAGKSNGDTTSSITMRRFFRKANGTRETDTEMAKYSSLPREPQRRLTETEMSSGGEASSPKFRSTTIMLLVVSFYVIFATLLGGLWYVLDIKFSIDAYIAWPKREFDTSAEVAKALRLRMTKIICDELALSHFAMGFVLYFCTGKNFRDEVRRLFTSCLGSNGADNLGNSISTDLRNSGGSRCESRERRRVDEPRRSLYPISSSSQSRISSIRRLSRLFKRENKRDNFPGLEQCGHRGERQRSKLLLMPKINADGVQPEPL